MFEKQKFAKFCYYSRNDCAREYSGHVKFLYYIPS